MNVVFKPPYIPLTSIRGAANQLVWLTRIIFLGGAPLMQSISCCCCTVVAFQFNFIAKKIKNNPCWIFPPHIFRQMTAIQFVASTSSEWAASSVWPLVECSSVNNLSLQMQREKAPNRCWHDHLLFSPWPISLFSPQIVGLHKALGFKGHSGWVSTKTRF